MLLKQKKYHIILTALLFFLSFAGTSYLSYFVAKQAYFDFIRNESLPLVSKRVYSDVQKDILPVFNVSQFMAHDAFVHEWYDAGEKDISLMKDYLRKIHQKFGFTTAFFISENTHNYYHFQDKPIKKIHPNNANDQWYFNCKKTADSFCTNLDTDHRTNGDYVLFVNYKLTDSIGNKPSENFVGIIGVGLSLKVLHKHFLMYKKKYKRKAYFLNELGKQVIKHDYVFNINPKIATTVNTISKNTSTSEKQNIAIQEYTNNEGKKVFANIRYIPELNWYLVVEEAEQTQTKLRQSLFFNLATAVLMTLLLMLLMKVLFGKYHDSLHNMATRDWLTGLFNRQACDDILQNLMLKSNTTTQPLSVLLLDVDHFKKINDNFGHANGDIVLKAIAKTINDSIGKQNYSCRWGGEEFLVILPKTDIKTANEMAQSILSNVRQTKPITDASINLSVSCGACQMADDEPADLLFKRLDKALYKAKHHGRDQVVIG